MKKVFIKYNPYNLETELTVDGKELAQNSKIRELIFSDKDHGTRLQEWIEDLPRILIEEYNDRDFDITFHGTILDFEDLTEVFTQAYEHGELTAKLDRIRAKETLDKEKLIDDIFNEIQEGPFAELCDAEIISAFQQAQSMDFEVCVVATMSAGKSTLINSMLGTQLMPSKQEACTAIITRIKDIDNADTWQAEVYDKGNHLIETHNNLSYSTMEKLNGDETVSTIKVTGNIPFVSANDTSLVLIDTPGPNNARDPKHGEVQRKFLKSNSKSLVLYIMEGTFGSTDDNALLEQVAASMKVGGKQSKDRFIFVLNKLDNRQTNDGDLSQTMDRIRTYLKKHGISNPNLYPAAALPALNIRLMQSGIELDEYILDDLNASINKFNRKNSPFRFETYASLPASIRRNINQQLEDAAQTNDIYTEALIHTGIVSIEAAIRQYVQKYAKTAKIKNIVDTFVNKLDELKYDEKLHQELLRNQKEGKRIADQISLIQQKITSAKSAMAFKEAVDNAVVKVNQDVKEVIESIIQKYQKELTRRIDSVRGKELNLSEVDETIEQFENLIKKLEPNFQADLDDLIHDNLVKTGNALFEEYKIKLASLTDEIDPASLAGISIDPIKLMGGSISRADDLTMKLVKEKEIEDGKEWIENSDKKWYKPWTWFQEKGYYRTKHKKVQFIYAHELAQKVFTPIGEKLLENGDAARLYAFEESNHIAVTFAEEFKRMDDILTKKLVEFKSYATDQEKVQQRIQETEQKLQWIEEIKCKVASILEI